MELSLALIYRKRGKAERFVKVPRAYFPSSTVFYLRMTSLAPSASSTPFSIDSSAWPELCLGKKNLQRGLQALQSARLQPDKDALFPLIAQMSKMMS
jgi:hypothetical protein